MEDVFVYVPFVNHEHLVRHALVPSVSARAILQERFASVLYRHFIGIGPIGARLHLAFGMNAEGVSGLLV